MPQHGHLCRKCGKPFAVGASMSDYSKGLAVGCPIVVVNAEIVSIGPPEMSELIALLVEKAQLNT